MILHNESKDACLSADGEAQAIERQREVGGLRVDHVLVSPMRRAVQTALLACGAGERGHGGGLPSPDKKIKIVFMPCLREQVTFKNTVSSSVSELKTFVQEVLDRNRIEKRKFKLDFSMMRKNDLWYLDQISDASTRKEIAKVANSAHSVSDSA